MRCHTNRSYAWAAAAMWNGKGFMQVEVANICSNYSWAGNAHLGIHISAIHVHLTSAFVNKSGDFLNMTFKYAMCGWIGDH